MLVRMKSFRSASGGSYIPFRVTFSLDVTVDLFACFGRNVQLSLVYNHDRSIWEDGHDVEIFAGQAGARFRPC